jgi:hypothetical protein
MASWLEEAGRLRQVQAPVPDAPPETVSEVLVAVRGRLDRLETLLGLAWMVRGNARRRAAEQQEDYDDRWDELAVRGKRNQPEFSAAKERTADYNLALVELRIQVRQAQKLASETDDVARRIELAYRGLDGLRQELLARLRAVTFLSSLEH